MQLALLIAGVACARALTEDHGLAPQFVAGHSVGAFAAAVTAGVLTLPEALIAVELRARLMEKACAQGDWGMAAVTGLPTRTAAEIVRKIATDDDPIWVANINSATQTVFSGTVPALQLLPMRRARGCPELRAPRRHGGIALSGPGRHRATHGRASGDAAPPRADGPLSHQYEGTCHHVSRDRP